MNKKSSVLLSSHIKPQRYQIHITPDLENFTFSGNQKIFLMIGKATREIEMHAVDLQIWEVNVKVGKSNFSPSPYPRKESGGLQPRIVTVNEKRQTVKFVFDRVIPKGKAIVSLRFRGTITDQLKGFYRSRYEVEGKEKYLGVTQFEATDARRAFPCFDEPAQKAVFELVFTVPKHLTVVSNTIETNIQHTGNVKTVAFAPTPKMSTYLAAFIIGELEYIGSRTKNNVLVRIFTTKGKKQQGKFALKIAIKCLEFYETFFGITYPLSVLDLIAIPDFASQAMENWGAVTYRETALLVDEKHTSTMNKQWIAIVIAHELAHQWFGNLVTMQWWNDLWLNEGFAEYMEFLCLDKIFPEWNLWDQYVSGRYDVGLRTDSLASTHPIEMNINDPDEISEAFDVPISYAKGSAVIRMIAHYLGEKDFRDGLRYYMKKHQYGNTVTTDLWEAFEQISKKPVGKVMKNWTQQPGYPLVSVLTNGNQLQLSQERFFSGEFTKEHGKEKTLWQVPVEILNPNETGKKLLLSKKSQKYDWRSSSWLKLNSGETGFYRVQYPQEMLEQFKPLIMGKILPTRDRFGIIRDVFALAQAGKLRTTDGLDLALSYTHETELPIWEEIAADIGQIANLFKGEQWFSDYEAYARAIFSPLAQRLGRERKKGDLYSTVLLRSLALMQAGNYGDKQVVSYAKKLFKRPNSSTLQADIRGVVYALVAKNGGDKEFRQFVTMYKQAKNNPEEQNRIGGVFGLFRDKPVLTEAVDYILSDNVRLQDKPFYFATVTRNHSGAELAWQTLVNHWDKLFEQYGQSGHLLDRFISPFSVFATNDKARELEHFFKKHPVPQAARTIRQTLEKIRSNAAWVKRDGKIIEEWLKKYGYKQKEKF